MLQFLDYSNIYDIYIWNLSKAIVQNQNLERPIFRNYKLYESFAAFILTLKSCH